MADFLLSCSTTADLSETYYSGRNIEIIPYHYELDGVDHIDDMGKTMSYEAFYEAMDDGASTRTSQINIDEYRKYFERLVSTGKDVLHLELSSGITGGVNSARLAAESVQAAFPGRRVVVVDSLAASAGMGLLLDGLADQRDQGLSLDECAAWVEKNRLNLQHWFFSTDLTSYIRGGRIGKTAGLVGRLLNICPLMRVNSHGALVVWDKVRGKRKVIQTIVKRMEALAANGTAYSGKVFISNSNVREDAENVARLIEATFPSVQKPIMINTIGTTIGSHTGSGTVALFFWGEHRTKGEEE